MCHLATFFLNNYTSVTYALPFDINELTGKNENSCLEKALTTLKAHIGLA